jgi:hypothetical protein
MNILYYELSQGRKTPVYFRFRHINKLYNGDNWGPLRLAHQSSRIWEWDTDTDQVRYIKNLYDGVSANTPVDRKKFLAVQLAAQDYKKEAF